MITEKRADGKVETEATIKIWVDGQRYVRTAEGNGPVNALDRALRDAITELHPHLADIELVNYKVRILDAHHGTGAVTRVLLDSSDGQESWGSIGVSENIIEASWEALVDSLEYAFQPRSDGPAARAGCRARRPAGAGAFVSDGEPIPLARPELGAREEELVLEVLRSGRLSLGPMLERFEREFAAGWGSTMRSRSPPAPPRSTSASGRWAGARATRWSTTPFSFVASANCLLYEGATPVFCDIDPVTLNLDPAAARAAVTDRTVGLLARPHLRLPGGAAGARGAGRASRGLGVLEDACEAVGAVDAEGVRVGGRGHLATFAFYANKQLTMGEGGVIIPSAPQIAARLRSERNQGRAEDMGWLAHERLGFNYRLTDLQAALGRRAARAGGRSCWPSALASPRSTASAWRRSAPAPRARAIPKASCCRARTAVKSGGAGSFTRSSCPRATDRDAVIAALAEQGRGGQGLSAVHPPDAALPGALRVPRGRVPGRRAGLGALAGAAVLHRHGRGGGRAGHRRAGRCAGPSAPA